MKQISVIRSASIFGLLAVAFGAFGAHGLKNLVSADAISTWETATRYQFYHAVVLLVISLLMFHCEHKFLKIASTFFVLGIILFSGSLYLLSLRSIIPVELIWLGPVTPLGGLCFMLGWIFLFVSASKIVSSKK